MSLNNLPPQAYTRDVLMAAYDWLQSQPGSVRELAVSPDSLVALYLQSRRRSSHVSTGVTASPSLPGHAQVPTPNSAQNPNPVLPISMQAPMTQASADAFKQDLKNLAEGLKQFDDNKTLAPAQQASSTLSAEPLTHRGMTPYRQTVPTTPQTQSVPQPTQQNPVQQPSPQPAAANDTLLQLDARSLALIQDVKHKLNLSHETEALRMLLALGFEKIRDILPKG